MSGGQWLSGNLADFQSFLPFPATTPFFVAAALFPPFLFGGDLERVLSFFALLSFAFRPSLEKGRVGGRRTDR